VTGHVKTVFWCSVSETVWHHYWLLLITYIIPDAVARDGL